LVLCGKLGAQTRKISLPKPAEAVDTYLAIFCADAADFHLAAFPESLPSYSDMPRSLLELPETLPGYRYSPRAATPRRDAGATQARAFRSGFRDRSNASCSAAASGCREHYSRW
jgi:hypothetical protein